MLQSAVSRLHNLFPDKQLYVFTDRPERLEYYCKNTVPFETSGRSLFMQAWNVFGKGQWLIPSKHRETFLNIEHGIRKSLPNIIVPWMKFRMQKRRVGLGLFNEFRNKLASADLVVSTGGGYINDSFPRHARNVLQTLDLACSLGKPTALLGQGIGPLTIPWLRQLAKVVLPRVDLIGLREGHLGDKVLTGLGVPENRIYVTGDDAIELAYKNRIESPGTDVGVNVRLSAYAKIPNDCLGKISKVINKFSLSKNTNLRPIPIAFNPLESDLKSFECLVGGELPDSVIFNQETAPTPLRIVKAAGLCRIVVTGSYHAAVFALAQGIPAIGLSSSEYYDAKFSGLKSQFGTGVYLVHLDRADFNDRFASALDEAWLSADSVRPFLLKAAESQIEAGCQFYNKVALMSQVK